MGHWGDFQLCAIHQNQGVVLLGRIRQISIEATGLASRRHQGSLGGPSLADQRRLAAFNRSENSSAPSQAATDPL